MELDRYDRQILAILQLEGRISNQDLADRIGLSPSPCLRRVRVLEESGLITGYRAILSPLQLGLTHVTYVEARLSDTRQKALEQLAGETVQYVTKEDLEMLKVLKTSNAEGKQFPYDEECQDLLEKVIVMEYNNGKYKRVNPIVEISDLYTQYVG